MKKTIFLSIFIMLVAFIVKPQCASAKRLVLFEQFTNTGCAPCARFSPSCDSMLMVRLGDVVAIKYHSSYPSPQDPFYLNEKENLDIRSAFYQISGVPTCIVNGKMINSSVPAISNRIDEQMQAEQRLDMDVECNISEKTLTVDVDITPLQSLDNDNLRLFVCVVEEEINFSEPVPNGETEFRYILKKFLPDANGYNLGKLTDTTKAYNYEVSWGIEGFYDESQLAVVVFIQDIETKEVYETVYAPRSTSESEAAKIILVEDTPNKICSPLYTAKVMFRNIGYNNMTSANICIDINGDVQKTAWEGNLAYLESATITTPDFTEFALKEGNEPNNVKIYVSDINNTQARSVAYQQSFDNSAEALGAVQLTIFTDNKPEETTWKLYNSAGEVVQEGGPYSAKRTFIKEPLNAPVDDCYRLEFLDSGADGIVGENGNGYYKIEQINEGKRKMIAQGDYKSDRCHLFFRLKEASGLVDIVKNSQCVYNSVDKQLCVNTESPATISVYDIMGHTVYARTLEGYHEIDLSRLQGIYIINIVIDNQSYNQKIFVE